MMFSLSPFINFAAKCYTPDRQTDDPDHHSDSLQLFTDIENHKIYSER